MRQDSRRLAIALVITALSGFSLNCLAGHQDGRDQEKLWHDRTAKTAKIQLGPRPFYLVNDM